MKPIKIMEKLNEEYNYFGKDTGEPGTHKNTHIEHIYTVRDQYGDIEDFKTREEAQAFIDSQVYDENDPEDYPEKPEYEIVEDDVEVSNKRIVVHDDLEESASSSTLNVDKIAKFIENSVNTLMEGHYTCCKYDLDEDLAIFVGWSDGYDGEDISEDELYLEKSPTWRINVGIKVRNDYDWTDFDYLDFPWYPDTGEVWDTGVTINKDEDYNQVADWMVKSYPEIVESHNKGEIVYYSDEETSNEVN